MITRIYKFTSFLSFFAFFPDWLLFPLFTFISLPWLRFLISNITTLLGTLCYKITRIYEFASFLSLFTYNQVPNNMLRIRVTFIEENLFEIKFETTVFETKKRSRHPFRSTRFRESRYLYSRHQAFSDVIFKSGVNFINVLRAALMLVDPKSAKKCN